MTTFNGETYSGDQVAEGIYSAGFGIVPPTFCGTSFCQSAITLTGTIGSVTDPLLLSIGSLAKIPVSFDGWFGTASDPTYVFSYFANGLPLSFAVTPDGQASCDVLQPLHTGTPPALPACFLEGVRIATPEGPVAVERLEVGDLVETRVDGSAVPSRVRWIGRRTVDVGALAEDDAYPVRIRANAFGASAPDRDLLLTSEHCIHVDGALVPVRLLVNGASITVERAMSRFTYYHVELDRHAILLADGLETESYLDTGNRGRFANASLVDATPDLALDTAHASWADAAAPLVTDRGFVEPIWNRLAERAVSLGLSLPPAPRTEEADTLRVLLENGQVVMPFTRDALSYSFAIPAGIAAVALLSDAASPADIEGRFVDDRRSLGVAVRTLTVHARRDSRIYPADALTQPGWHALEGETRWSNGQARLDLPRQPAESILEVALSAIMRRAA